MMWWLAVGGKKIISLEHIIIERMSRNKTNRDSSLITHHSITTQFNSLNSSILSILSILRPRHFGYFPVISFAGDDDQWGTQINCIQSNLIWISSQCHIDLNLELVHLSKVELNYRLSLSRAWWHELNSRGTTPRIPSWRLLVWRTS